MTTREDKRFTAAVACLQGILGNSSLIIRSAGTESESISMLASDAIRLADQLLAKLDETEPPTSLNLKCQHVICTQGFSKTIARGECPLCHEVLP